MVQSMMDFVTLPISFWGYALSTVCYVLNKVSSKSVNKIPYEIWTGRKPMLSYLRVWGCPTYVKCLKTDKFGSRSDKYLFVGYSKEMKAYYFYLIEEQKVFVSNKVVFLEREFFYERIDATKIELGEVREVENRYL